MKITKLVSDLLQSNTYILEKNGEVLIVDAGCRPEKLLPLLEGKKVMALLLTHGHYDHSAYCNEYASIFNIPIYASGEIKFTLTDSKAIYSENNQIIDNFSNFHFILKDCTIKIGNFDVECFACPGHSKCCECYMIDGQLFAGDVLFEKSFGRVDLIGSNKKDMLSSLIKVEGKNFEKVYSGHGNESTFDDQQKNIKIFKRFLTR